MKSRWHKSLVFVSLVFILANVFTYAQEVTSAGALTYSYPLNLPAGRNGVAPNLSLVYNSNAGNGMLGVGWSLGGLSIITRDSSYPVTFNDAADHFLLDGQKLVLGSDGYYHTEKESYVRIQFINPDTSSSYWIVTLKNGTKMYYGWDDDDHDSTNDGHVNAVGTGGKALVWCLSRVEDVNGNYYVVRYSEDDTNGDYYPLNIEWTLPYATTGFSHIVEFYYDSDASGNAARTDHGRLFVPTMLDLSERLKWIVVRTHGIPVRKYRIDYSYGISTKRSKIDSITEYGNDGTSWPTYDSVPKLRVARSYTPDGSKLPPVKLTWSDGSDKYDILDGWTFSINTGEKNLNRYFFSDVNGDGKSDMIKIGEASTSWVEHADSSGHYNLEDGWKYIIATGDYSHNIYNFADVNGDGKSDLIKISDDTLTWVELADSNGNYDLSDGWTYTANTRSYRDGVFYSHYFSDVNGDGRSDMIMVGPYSASSIVLADENGNYNLTTEWTYYVNTGRYYGQFNHYFSDVNGDGRSDLIQTGPDSLSWIELASSNGNYNISDGWSYTINTGRLGSSYQHYFSDLNGDGKSDLIQTGPDSLSWIELASTNGNYNISDGWSYTINTGRYGSIYQHYFSDINGDGRSDLIQIGPGLDSWIELASPSGNYNITDGWEYSVSTGRYNGLYEHYLSDINGDGKSDLIQIGFYSTSWVELSNGINNDLLTTITLPTGGTVNVTYEPAPQVTGAVVPNTSNTIVADSSPRNLVTKIEIDDRISHGSANTIVTEYEYYNHLKTTGFSHERTDLGFEWIKKIDKSGDSSNSTYDAYMKTYYSQEQPYEGLVEKVETYGGDGDMYSQTVYTYGTRQVQADPEIDFIYKATEDTYSHNGEDGPDGTGGTPVHYRVKYCPDPENPTDAYYDEKGNLKQVDNLGDINTTIDDASVYTVWISNTAGTVWVPKSIEKKAYKLDGVTFASAAYQELYYDEQLLGTVVKGLLTKKMIDNADDDVTLTYGYDSNNGNLLWFRDGKMSGGTANTITYVYEDNYKTYLLTETNAAGHVTTIGYDTTHMWPTQVTDANGQVWKTHYDAFGRVDKTAAPLDNISTTPTKQYTYTDPEIDAGTGNITTPGYVQASVRKDPESIYSPSYSYYDGLGRVIQTKTPTETADIWTTVDYFYDASGRNDKTSVPYPISANPVAYTTPDTTQKIVETKYDTIGRVIKTTNTDTTFSRTVYEKKRVVSVDERGYASSKEVNGNIVTEKSFEDTYTDPTYPLPTIDPYYWVQTKAAWDGVEIWDKSNPTLSIKTECDMLGRKSSYTDPNMGTWSYTYDKNGNLLTQIDANNQNKSTEEKKSLVFEYDNLNRIHYKKLKTGTAEPVTQVEYIYDNGGLDVTNDIGRLVRVNFVGGSEAYVYDERGRVVSITMDVDGNVKTFSYTYNSADQLVNETYPTGEVLTYHYDSAGQLDKVTGVKAGEGGWTVDYAKDIGYTTLNKLKSITYGNNVKTTYDYYDTDSETDDSRLDPQFRKYSYRLKNITVINQNDSNKTLSNTTYKYDLADNIVSKTFAQDYGLGYRETFTYDHVNRLKTVTAKIGDTDIDFYPGQSYDYSPNNNMTRKGDKYYSYSTTEDPGRPHAVKKITNEAGNIEYYSYEYDANGNMRKAEGHSVVTISAKKTGDQNPRMELWFDDVQYMVWNITNTDYHPFMWNGLLKAGSQIRVLITGGGESGHLFINSVKVNNTTLLDNTQTEITYSAEWSHGSTGISALDRTIGYNSDNKVESITENGNSSSFTYDYAGSRIKKVETFNGVTATTYYFGSKYEEQVSGSVTKHISYYFQNGQRVAQRTNDGTTNEVLYYHTDHLGSAVRLTDSQAIPVPVQSIAYAPYGETVFYSGIKDPSYQFTGQELDAPSGLYYYGARYYCPEIGRFIQADTVLDGLNRYAYCWNNPMNYVDPTGMYTDYSHGAPRHYHEVSNGSWSNDTSVAGTRYERNANDNYLDTVGKSGSSNNNSSTSNSSVKPGNGERKTQDNTGTSAAPPVDSSNPPIDPNSTNPYKDGKNAPWTGQFPIPKKTTSSPGNSPSNSGNTNDSYPKDKIKFAPEGKNWTYTGPWTSTNHYCNIYTNNEANLNGGIQDTSFIINQWPCYSFAKMVKQGVTKTKKPIPNSIGALYEFWGKDSAHQPQHVEGYTFIDGTLIVYESWGLYSQPPTGVKYDPDHVLEQLKKTRDGGIIDCWFIPFPRR